MTVNKVSKYTIVKEVKDWALAGVFVLWGGSFINDKFINPPKAENPDGIRINIDLGEMTDEQKLRARDEALRFMEEVGKIRGLAAKNQVEWDNAPPPPMDN
jgi:hypothetical protein